MRGMQTYTFIVVLLIVLVAFVAGQVQKFHHPGVLVNKDQLNWTKTQVEAKAEPEYTAYKKALASEYGSLTYKAQGPPGNGIIGCGEDSSPDDGCSADDSDSTTAYLQALLWVITENKQYATNAINLLNRYANNLRQFNNTNAPLQAAWSAQKWTKAAEIIRHTNAGWTDEGIAAYTKLLESVYLPLIENGYTGDGNGELAMIDGMIGIAVFTENSTLFYQAADFWSARVPAYFYFEDIDGDKPHPAPRGHPSWYGETIFNSSVSGLMQETCRDMAHAQYGLTSAFNAAETARIQGFNLYGLQAPRLLAALEFNAKFLIGGPIPEYLCGTGKVNLYNNPTFEVAYFYYHAELRRILGNTWQQLTQNVRTLENLSDGHTCVWETLTHGSNSPS